MTTERAHGTARERAAVAAMILIGVALPVVAKLDLFQNAVWALWLAAFALIIGALVLTIGVTRRERRARDS
ncbi:hypothetical protein [Microbacterium paraoxydans]|uniref:hypothetical protein n=1 Tax=Microbacterium paraoxydans TaxID=199592 RepID=UPI003D725AEE